MGKLMCHHCRRSFSIPDLGKEELAERVWLLELDGRHYCQKCRDNFCTCLIEDAVIVKRARLIGMEFIKPKSFWYKLWN